MKRLFSLTRALVARKRKIFALFFALAASIGMMNAKVTWNSSNVSDIYVSGTYADYSKEGVTLRANADMIDAWWQNYGDESMSGISFNTHATGGFTFSNTLGKNFTKIVMSPKDHGGWDMANLGSGWSISGDIWNDEPITITWTGNASTVDLLKEASDFGGENVKSIVFYFVGDSEAPDPTYTVALKAGTANADKVTLSATSAIEGATVTVTPDDEYEITAFSAYYVVVEDQLGSIYDIDATLNAETGAYSFTMPAANVTIEATIAAKPVPEGDIYAGFTATAGSGGFTNEGHANLVDGKFISAEWTKWCTNNDHRSVPTGESGDACWWIDFEASAALNLTGYSLTTGNDTGSEYGRNPKNWLLKAKLNADDAWTTIATVTNDVTMKNQNFKDYKFYVDQSGPYQYFRFEVFANQGANVMQLCELRLIGTEAAAPVNSCGDGLTWELNNGELVISYDGEGTGVMNDFEQGSSPWKDQIASITSVVINEGAKNIGKNAFYECEKITTVTLANSVETIGQGAFRKCYDLTSLELGNNIKTIEQEAFLSCADLKTVTIGTGITSIGIAAFNGCAELTTVTCSATTPPSIGDMVFGSCPKLTHIYVPTESVDAYKTAWSAYASLILAAGGGGTPDGALSGAFTINANGDKIVFSKGNLQATTTDLGTNWTWDFAPNQWSLIGNAVANNAIKGNKNVSANGTVDLFGWSTAATYYGINESWNNDDYAGDFVDWGALMGTEWRTLSRAEWLYIVYDRTDAYKKHGQATVNGVPGYVLLPDVWTLPSGLSFTYSVDNYTTNQYNGADWTAMESAGAVFLPAAGVREGTDIYQVNLYGWYWASTPNETDGGKAYYLYFDKSSEGVTEYNRWKSKSVRLVTEAPIPPYEAAIKLISAIGEVAYTAECKAKIDAARAAYDALNDGDKAQVTNLTTLTDAETTYAGLLAQAVKAVKDQIDALPATPLTDATKKLSEYNKVTAAREAYNALSDAEKTAVSNYDKLTAAEAAFAAIGGGGGSAPDGALNSKFTINAGGDQIAFAKGNLQATTTDLGANWTWSFAANQWDYLGIAVANSKINGNGTVSENGTVDLFGWSTAATYYGINNSYKAVDYIGDFVDWGPNMGAGWRTLTKDEWNYLIENNTKGRATVNDKNGYIFLPNDWSGPAFTANPDNFTTNVYSGDDWTAMENAGAVFLPSGPARNGTYALIANDAKYCSSTSLNNDTSYVFTIYYNQSQSACTGTNRAYGCMVRLVTAGASSPLADAQAVKDLIDAIGEVNYPDSKEAIKAAREALDALSDEAKALFAEADTAALPAAEATYAGLLAEKVAPVIAAIDAIPSPIEDNLKLSAYDKVTDARALYDALATDEEKNAVTNYDKLTAAEAAFAAIGGGAGLNVSTEDIGKVLCADGSLYATKDEATAASKTPVAMIAYVEDSKGLAIALEDESNTMIWSTAITTAAAHTPAVTGGTWKLPSLLEWQQMFVGCGADLTPSETSGNVTDYLGLRDKLLAAGGNGFVEWSYWTTTEWADNPAEAWDPYFSPDIVKWYKNKKDRDDFYIRAILAFNVVASTALADAQAAKDLIDAIPSPVVVTDDCKAKIDAAREAVTALGENASLIDDADIDKLEKAEEKFAELIKDATAVVAKIDAIGDVTFSAECKEKIVDARNAYEALSDELKPYVTNLTKLTDAEAAYEAARPFAPVTTVPAAVEALQYTGAAQTLITAGAVEHGTILYSLDGVDYSTELPTALLPGAYTVYYKVQATDDYKDVAPTTFIATIAYNYPATYGLFGIPEGWSVKVNDEEVAVVNGAVKNIAANDRFDIMPVKPEDVKLVEIVPYLLDLATATDSVIYLMNGDSITGTANGNITIVIVPDAKVYFKDVNLTNTGSHPAVLCGGNAEMVVVGENSITCSTEGEYGIRTAGAGTTLTISGDKAHLSATIDPNGGTVNQ